MKVRSAGSRIGVIGAHGWLLFSLMITMIPFLWVAMMTTHTRVDIFSAPPPFYFGKNLANNYDTLMSLIPFWKIMLNSISVSVLGTIAALFCCSSCAYALVAFEFTGKKLVFGIIIGSMMIPSVFSIIPFFLTAKALGMLDTHIAIWLPAAVGAFGIFLLRQYMATVLNRDLRDAAAIDGVSHFRIYWSIALPLSRPALATLGIMQFIGLWNSFLTPLIILSSPDKYVLPLALRSVQGLISAEWGGIMLGAFLSMLPLIVVFLFFSRQMIAGLTSGSVKG